jgi:hypothetical protein
VRASFACVPHTVSPRVVRCAHRSLRLGCAVRTRPRAREPTFFPLCCLPGRRWQAGGACAHIRAYFEGRKSMQTPSAAKWWLCRGASPVRRPPSECPMPPFAFVTTRRPDRPTDPSHHSPTPAHKAPPDKTHNTLRPPCAAWPLPGPRCWRGRRLVREGGGGGGEVFWPRENRERERGTGRGAGGRAAPPPHSSPPHPTHTHNPTPARPAAAFFLPKPVPYLTWGFGINWSVPLKPPCPPFYGPPGPPGPPGPFYGRRLLSGWRA